MKQISLSRMLFILNQRNLHLPKNINGPKTRQNSVTQHRKGQASCQECLDPVSKKEPFKLNKLNND